MSKRDVRRSVLGVMVVFWGAMFFACGGGGGQVSLPTTTPATQAVPTTKPPAEIGGHLGDISYAVISENYDDPLRQQKTKRSVEVRISRIATEAELREIAPRIKDADPTAYDRTFILYYLPGMPTDGQGAWASTHYNPYLEVRIYSGPWDNVKTEDNAASDDSPPTTPAKPLARPLDPARVWTDAAREHTVEAQFVTRIGDKVKLKKTNGDIVVVPVDQLSEEDQQWLRDKAKGRSGR